MQVTTATLSLVVLYIVCALSENNRAEASTVRRWREDLVEAREELRDIMRLIYRRISSGNTNSHTHPRRTTPATWIYEPPTTISTTTTTTTLKPTTTTTTTPEPTTIRTISTKKPGIFLGENKQGLCLSTVTQSECSTECLWDDDCLDSLKCCNTQCGGTACVVGVHERPKTEKPGQCPAVSNTRWICSSRCSSDADCRRGKKCCRNRCGAFTCINPDAQEMVNVD